MPYISVFRCLVSKGFEHHGPGHWLHLLWRRRDRGWDLRVRGRRCPKQVSFLRGPILRDFPQTSSKGMGIWRDFLLFFVEMKFGALLRHISWPLCIEFRRCAQEHWMASLLGRPNLVRVNRWVFFAEFWHFLHDWILRVASWKSLMTSKAWILMGSRALGWHSEWMSFQFLLLSCCFVKLA